MNRPAGKLVGMSNQLKLIVALACIHVTLHTWGLFSAFILVFAILAMIYAGEFISRVNGTHTDTNHPPGSS